MQISILHSNKCCREENFTTIVGVGCTKPDLFCPVTPPHCSSTCSAPLPHTPSPLLLVLKWFPQSLCWDGCCKGCSIFQLHQVRKHSFLHARNPVKNNKNINCKGDHLSMYKCMLTHKVQAFHRKHFQVTTQRSTGNSPSFFLHTEWREGHLTLQEKNTVKSAKSTGGL